MPCANLTVTATVLQAAQRLLGTQLRGRDVRTSPQPVRDFLQIKLGGLEHEVFAVLMLDAQNRLIEHVELFRGRGKPSVGLSTRVGQGIADIQCHSGDLFPQRSLGRRRAVAGRKALTDTLKTALSLVDVPALDHLIVAGNDVMCFAERGPLDAKGRRPLVFCLIVRATRES